MTDDELRSIARAVAPVMRDLITQSLAVLTVKVAALEAREAVHGRDGLPGVPGPAGERGPAGEPGPVGAAGQDGVNGADGKDGAVGPAGEHGQDGAEGPIGPQGVIGLVGPAGAVGESGIDGVNGKDGAPGLMLDLSDLLSITSTDDGRTLAFTFKRGETEIVQTVKTAVLLDRGVYAAGKSYAPGDGVTLGGSFWIAKAETAERPGTDAGAASWRLAVKAGQEGKRGPAGPAGPSGANGRDGLDLTRSDNFGRKA